MKRIFNTLCALLVCVACFAELTSTLHNFESSDPSIGPTGYEESYTICHMGDGTTYTCKSGAVFAINPSTSAVCISIPVGGVVEVSPAREGLTSFTVTHNSISGGANMKLYTSTDGDSWTEIPEGQLDRKNDHVEATNLSGNCYVKLENTAVSGTIYVRFITYYTNPCHCLKVVSE